MSSKVEDKTSTTPRLAGHQSAFGKGGIATFASLVLGFCCNFYSLFLSLNQVFISSNEFACFCSPYVLFHPAGGWLGIKQVCGSLAAGWGQPTTDTSNKRCSFWRPLSLFIATCVLQHLCLKKLLIKIIQSKNLM